MAIICATDFSPCSRTAARVAAGLARRRGEALVLVHILPPEPADLAAMEALVEGLVEDTKAHLRADLATEADQVGDQRIAVGSRIIEGLPSERLVDLSRAPDTSTLVMGMYGMGRGQRLLVGSCAESVIRAAGCPVLVVPEHAAQVDTWRSDRPLRLMLATDGSQATGALFYWARTSAPATPRSMPIVRMYWPPQEAARYGIDRPWYDNAGSPELLELVERDVRRDAAALSTDRAPDVRLQVLVRNGAEELAETTRAMNVDAVAIGIPRHRFRHWTPVDPKALLRDAGVPVFCIPEAVQPAARRIPHYRTVLIASDLSELSHEAMLPAYGLLTAGGRVELCYVHHIGDPPLIDHSNADLPLSDTQRQALVAALEGQVPAEAPEHGIATRVSVVEGRSIATALLQAAERAEADAIALATHGRSGIGRFMLGSVAEEVARRSCRPVLLIHARPVAGSIRSGPAFPVQSVTLSSR